MKGLISVFVMAVLVLSCGSDKSSNPASTSVISGSYPFQEIFFGTATPYSYKAPDATGSIILKVDGTFTFLLTVTRAPNNGSIYYEGVYTFASNSLVMRTPNAGDLNSTYDLATNTITIRMTWGTTPITATYRRS